MNIYEQNQEFYNSLIRLTEEQQKEPLEVISDFFTDFHLWESRNNLATLLEVAFTKSNLQFGGAGQRNEIATFAEKLEELIEAAYILQIKKE
jgi:hypothetical protein